ncbi:MAG: FxsA family protein [Pseudobdellovibrionaceae bacterium]|jgi:UPF0716 protein FxsA
MPFLLLIIFPVLELYGYYRFALAFSFWDAVLIGISSGVLGLFIMLTQGRAALLQLQVSLQGGQVPSSRIMHRVMMALGGFLIFIPGLVSDVMGIFLILPGLRHLIVFLFKLKLIKFLSRGNFRIFSGGFGAAGGFGTHGGFPGSDFPQEPRQERDAQVIDITALASQRQSKKDQ